MILQRQLTELTMDLPKNHFKAALAAGRAQLGLWLSINDSMVAEMLAGCGYDWILIDTEHTAMDHIAVLPLLQAIAPYSTQAIVRPGSLDVAEIKKYLDCGAQTLLIPNVQTAEEARLAVASVEYGPLGVRGVAGITRASRFGAVMDYTKRAREEICLIAQVESALALRNLEAIATTEGIDGVFIGPADLAATMGFPGEPNHPDVQVACLDGLARLKALGVPSGFLTLDQGFLGQAVAAGCLFPAIDVDAAILRSGAIARLESWRTRTPS